MLVLVTESLRLDHETNIKVNNLAASLLTIGTFLRGEWVSAELSFNIYNRRRVPGPSPCYPE